MDVEFTVPVRRKVAINKQIKIPSATDFHFIRNKIQIRFILKLG